MIGKRAYHRGKWNDSSVPVFTCDEDEGVVTFKIADGDDSQVAEIAPETLRDETDSEEITSGDRRR